MSPVVEITNLKKVYLLGKVPVNALCGVDLNVEKGDFLLSEPVAYLPGPETGYTFKPLNERTIE